MSEDAVNIVKVEMFEDYSLSFDWSTFLVRICHKQQLNDDYIPAGEWVPVETFVMGIKFKLLGSNVMVFKII